MISIFVEITGITYLIAGVIIKPPVWPHTRNLAEAAGASTIMAALKIKDKLRGKKVVLQMSGANESLEVVAKALNLML